jgi:hypothetical protein
VLASSHYFLVTTFAHPTLATMMSQTRSKTGLSSRDVDNRRQYRITRNSTCISIGLTAPVICNSCRLQVDKSLHQKSHRIQAKKPIKQQQPILFSCEQPWTENKKEAYQEHTRSTYNRVSDQINKLRDFAGPQEAFTELIVAVEKRILEKLLNATFLNDSSSIAIKRPNNSSTVSSLSENTSSIAAEANVAEPEAVTQGDTNEAEAIVYQARNQEDDASNNSWLGAINTRYQSRLKNEAIRLRDFLQHCKGQEYTRSPLGEAIYGSMVALAPQTSLCSLELIVPLSIAAFLADAGFSPEEIKTVGSLCPSSKTFRRVLHESATASMFEASNEILQGDGAKKLSHRGKGRIEQDDTYALCQDPGLVQYSRQQSKNILH